MLSLTQFMIFELGTGCNLQHPWCPNGRLERWSRLDTVTLLSDDTIYLCAREAYRSFGFTGMIGWHYHNEPLLQADRMFALMDRIRGRVPEARFVLWTNGLLLPDDCRRFEAFDLIHCTCYDQADEAKLLVKLDSIPGQADKVLHVRTIPDGRLEHKTGSRYAPCKKPLVEFVLDAYGNHHACCYDWQGRASLGNVYADGFSILVQRWRNAQAACVGDWMDETAPLGCLECGHKESEWPEFCSEIVERQQAYLQSLDMEGLPA